MDNHFHILLKQIKDGGVTTFMQKVATAYAMYFNKKYKRTGGLFEGAFKSKHIEDDTYLKYLFAYIHLNPAKMVEENWRNCSIDKREDIKNFIKSYPYSSFYDYCGILRAEKNVLTANEFPLYFDNAKDFTQSVLSWIRLEEKD